MLAGMSFSVWTIHKRPIVEDEILKDAFGKEWEEWASVTRYKLFPGIL